MRNWISLTVLCLFGGCGIAGVRSDAEEKAPIEVLFIGNSYTYVNDLPGILTEMCRARADREIETGQYAPVGYTLLQHARDDRAAAAIRSKKWDFVVLQEQSQIPFMAPQIMSEGAARIDAMVLKTQAHTLFYLTWARSSQPEKQTTINHSYFHCADALHASVVPVGIAWQRARQARPWLELYDGDGSHPSPAGTYLAACVFYAKLLGKSPEGLPASLTHNGQVLAAIAPDDATVLQRIAWRTVQDVENEKSAE